MVRLEETGEADLKPRVLIADTSSSCLLSALLNPSLERLSELSHVTQW